MPPPLSPPPKITAFSPSMEVKFKWLTQDSVIPFNCYFFIIVLAFYFETINSSDTLKKNCVAILTQNEI